VPLIGGVWWRSPQKLNAFLSQRVIVALKWWGDHHVEDLREGGWSLCGRPIYYKGAAEKREAAAPTASPWIRHWLDATFRSTGRITTPLTAGKS